MKYNSDYLLHETGSIRFGRIFKSDGPGWGPDSESEEADSRMPGVGQETIASTIIKLINDSDKEKNYDARIEFTPLDVLERVGEAWKINLKDAESNGINAMISGLNRSITPGDEKQIGVSLEIPYEAQTGIYEGNVILSELEGITTLPLAIFSIRIWRFTPSS